MNNSTLHADDWGDNDTKGTVAHTHARWRHCRQSKIDCSRLPVQQLAYLLKRCCIEWQSRHLPTSANRNSFTYLTSSAKVGQPTLTYALRKVSLFFISITITVWTSRATRSQKFLILTPSHSNIYNNSKVTLLPFHPLFTHFRLTLVLGWACRSSSAVCTSWPPIGEPPRLGPWWQTLHSLPARRWRRGTLPSSGAPGWSATAGSAWSLGLTRACRPILGRQTLEGKRGTFRWLIMKRGKFKERKKENSV